MFTKLGLAIATKTVLVGAGAMLAGSGLTLALTKWRDATRAEAAAQATNRIVHPR